MVTTDATNTSRGSIADQILFMGSPRPDNLFTKLHHQIKPPIGGSRYDAAAGIMRVATEHLTFPAISAGGLRARRMAVRQTTWTERRIRIGAARSSNLSRALPESDHRGDILAHRFPLLRIDIVGKERGGSRQTQ